MQPAIFFGNSIIGLKSSLSNRCMYVRKLRVNCVSRQFAVAPQIFYTLKHIPETEKRKHGQLDTYSYILTEKVKSGTK